MHDLKKKVIVTCNEIRPSKGRLNHCDDGEGLIFDNLHRQFNPISSTHIYTISPQWIVNR
ncbi:hypothetical protein HanIR_Chr08g0379651 [Helianthus annuus]|nr:hypothetical protein HanIR_Chr08g0379651 [Helianthus annuus]